MVRDEWTELIVLLFGSVKQYQTDVEFYHKVNTLVANIERAIIHANR